MVRTTVTPKNTDLHVHIPTNYVGKELEVLVYAKEELNGEKPKPKTMSAYKGILTAEEADEMQGKKKLSELAGKLSHETANKILKEIEEGRKGKTS